MPEGKESMMRMDWHIEKVNPVYGVMNYFLYKQTISPLGQIMPVLLRL